MLIRFSVNSITQSSLNVLHCEIMDLSSIDHYDIWQRISLMERVPFVEISHYFSLRSFKLILAFAVETIISLQILQYQKFDSETFSA